MVGIRVELCCVQSVYTIILPITNSCARGKLYASMSNKSNHLALIPLIELFMQQPTDNDWVNGFLA